MGADQCVDGAGSSAGEITGARPFDRLDLFMLVGPGMLESDGRCSFVAGHNPSV
jgi:hypothetical protein